jgi:multiple sugar transport system permease protein
VGEKQVAYLLILPSIILLAVFTAFPLFFSLYLSFFNVNPSTTRSGYPFIGLNNYIQAVSDPVFWQSLFNTFYMVFFLVTIELLIGLVLALTFTEEFKFKNRITPILIIPTMVVPIAIGFTFKLFFTLNYGIISYIGNWMTGASIPWLINGTYATWAIIITDVWEWSPFMFMMLLAGMTSLPQAVAEAAQLDGSSTVQTFINITLPLLRPIILVALLIRSIDALKLFDVPLMLTGGGPGTSTQTLTFYIYNEQFIYYNQGYGAATSFLMLVIVMVFTTLFIRTGAWFPGKAGGV